MRKLSERTGNRNPLLVLLCMLLLASCVREGPADHFELERLLKKADPAYAFDRGSAFIYRSEYCFFYSFSSPHDTLLKLHEDEYRCVDKITLACVPSAGAPAAFTAFSRALLKICIPEKERETVESDLRLNAPESLFADGVYTHEGEKYSAVLTTAEECVCMELYFAENYDFSAVINERI